MVPVLFRLCRIHINSCDEKTQLNDEGTSKRCTIDEQAQLIHTNTLKVSHSRLHWISVGAKNEHNLIEWNNDSSAGWIEWGDWQEMLCTICIPMGRQGLSQCISLRLSDGYRSHRRFKWHQSNGFVHESGASQYGAMSILSRWWLPLWERQVSVRWSRF